MTLKVNANKLATKGEPMADWALDQIPIIRYKGQFDWLGLYRLTRMWFEHNNYKFQEKKYKHKGDEVEVQMVGMRKVDEMHRYHVDIFFHIWNIRNIEVVEGSRTLKRNTGNVHVEIHSTLELDWTGKFEESGKIGKMMYKWWKIIRKKEIEATYLEPLTFELYKLQTDIKTFLNMSTDANYYGD